MNFSYQNQIVQDSVTSKAPVKSNKIENMFHKGNIFSGSSYSALVSV